MAFLGLAFAIIISTGIAIPAETPVMLDEYVPMRDGVLLYTKVYLPDPNIWGNGPYPTIFTATPYGIGSPGVAPATWPSEVLHGYAFVHQDHRGRNKSAGVWNRATDGKDGFDTIGWISAKSWCNRKIGMAGMSAMGIATYQTAAERPPYLLAIQPKAASGNRINTYTMESNAIELEGFLAWSAYVVPGLSPSHIASLPLTPAELAAARALYGVVSADLFSHLGAGLPVTSQYWMNLPLYDFPGLSPFLPYWNETLSHPNQDAWRDSWNIQDKINVPGLHWGGWYDIYSRGILEAYQVTQKNVGNQKLFVTSGTHGSIAKNVVSDPYFPWFDYWLKGIDITGILSEPPISYYRMGAEKWAYADQWPLPDVEEEKYYLHSNNTLSSDPPGYREASISFKYDPENPVSTMGGRNLFIPAGGLDQTSVEPPTRTDVLVYTSEELKNDVEIAGHIKVVLHASSDRKDTDFVAKLVDVYPDGKKILVIDGVVRARYRDSLKTPNLMTPGSIYEFTIELGDTNQVFKTGHRIQVDITSSNFPRRDRNPNTGHELYVIDKRTDTLIANNTIYHNAANPSYIVLPVVMEKKRIFEGEARIKTPGFTYEGPATLYTLAKGVYLYTGSRWIKWDIEKNWEQGMVEHYKCDGKLGELSVLVQGNAHASFSILATGEGIHFKGK